MMEAQRPHQNQPNHPKKPQRRVAKQYLKLGETDLMNEERGAGGFFNCLCSIKQTALRLLPTTNYMKTMKKNRKQRKMLTSFYRYACSAAQLQQLRGGCCNGSDNEGNPPPPPPKKTTAAGNQAIPEAWGN
jgi:hypothetical protein